MNKTYYKSSKKVVAILSLFFIILILIILGVNTDSSSSVKNIAEAVIILIVVYGFILLSISISKVEIDKEKNTITYRNGLVASDHVLINKVLQIGYPKQNYIVRSLNSFIYIWYDDPNQPGKDCYIKIRDAQFDSHTIANMVDDLRHINPNIKLDLELAELLKNN
jgi:hypothetical protein